MKKLIILAIIAMLCLFALAACNIGGGIRGQDTTPRQYDTSPPVPTDTTGHREQEQGAIVDYVGQGVGDFAGRVLTFEKDGANALDSKQFNNGVALVTVATNLVMHDNMLNVNAPFVNWVIFITHGGVVRRYVLTDSAIRAGTVTDGKFELRFLVEDLPHFTPTQNADFFRAHLCVRPRYQALVGNK